MTVDLYAGAGSGLDGKKILQAAGSATFIVIADADANLLARVSAALNLLNVAPREFHMEARPGGSATLNALVDCSEAQAELVARKLQQITSVRDVTLRYATAQE
jgi:hypothetical protein